MRPGRNKFTELVTLSSFTTGEGEREMEREEGEEKRVMLGSKDRQGVGQKKR